MLNWAGSLTISSYLVIGEGWTAKKNSNFFLALKLHCSLGRFSLSAVKNRPLKLQCSLGTFHFECGWDTESAEKYTYVSLEPGFQSTQIAMFPGNVSVWVHKKTGHSNANHLYTGFGPWFGPDSIYILELGLDSGLIQFIYWIRALIRARFNLYTGFGPRFGPDSKIEKKWKLKNQKLVIAISTISMRRNMFFWWGRG